MKKILTIVTTAYNAGQYLEKFFRNIEACDGFSTFQLIAVLNDPSPKEIAIANKYAQKHSNNVDIIIVGRENIGTSLNRGFRLARTEYVAYVDVDDQRNEMSFTYQLKTLEENRDADFTYGDFIIVPKQGIRRGRYVRTQEFDRELFSKGSYVGSSHMFKKSLIEKCGYWDEQLKSGGDFDFQVRAALNGKFVKTDFMCTYYTQSRVSGSASSGSLQEVEALLISLRYGIYDKVHMYLHELPGITRYKCEEILIDNNWDDIRRYIGDYDSLIKARRDIYWPKGYACCKVDWRRDLVRTIKNNFKIWG